MEFKNIFKILMPYRTMMLRLAIYAILMSVIAAIVPFLSSYMIDHGLLPGKLYIVLFSVTVILLLQISDTVLQYLQTRQNIQLTNALGKELKLQAFEHGLKLKPVYFKDHGFYKTIGDALYDIGNIMNITNSNFLIILVILFKAAGAAVGLLILDWRLALYVAALIPIKICINFHAQQRAEMLGDSLMLANKAYHSWFSDILSGILDIKIWNLQTRKVAEYKDHVDNINQASEDLSLMTAGNTVLMQTVELIFTNGLYVLGALLINGNTLTFGNLIAFISFASYLLAPVNALMDLRIILKQIRPSIESLKHFHKLKEENYSSLLPLDEKIRTIEFRNVCIAFDGRQILHNINFKLHRGDKIALVGENGCGKTTLINLLLRICEPTSGEILMNGKRIDFFNIEEYRSHFSVVAQDIHLFQGTVRDNLLLSENDSALPERLPDFCTASIKNWQNGFRTPVGTDGDKLSGGERQKIAFLRALCRQSDIMILDEPTSSYDRESEDAFLHFIRCNTDYGFYLIITHRKSVLSCVDHVFHLADGRLSITESRK